MDDACPEQNFTISRFIHEGRPVAFAVRNRDDLIQGEHHRLRFYEMDQLHYHLSLIPQQAVVIDIGANVGNHSVFYGLFTRASRIVAVEPNAEAASILEENIRLNGLSEKVTSMRGVALGAARGRGRLFNPQRGGRNLGAVRVVAATEGDAEVAIERGDDLFESLVADFVKIDVEGAEMGVLSGLTETIRKGRPVLSIEIENRNLPAFAEWCATNGYRIERTFRMYRGLATYTCVAA